MASTRHVSVTVFDALNGDEEWSARHKGGEVAEAKILVSNRTMESVHCCTESASDEYIMNILNILFLD